jgi:hypothetical protein
MAFLGKEILKRDTFKRKTIDIPEWGGQIIVRGLSGNEAIAINQTAVEISLDRQAGKFDAAKAERWEANTVIRGWINEDGSAVLSPTDVDDLLGKETEIISRIAREIRILSGMEKAKADDPSPSSEAKKNSTETPNAASGSA